MTQKTITDLSYAELSKMLFRVLQIIPLAEDLNQEPEKSSPSKDIETNYKRLQTGAVSWGDYNSQPHMRKGLERQGLEHGDLVRSILVTVPEATSMTSYGHTITGPTNLVFYAMQSQLDLIEQSR
jgi:hypothetical protein